MIIHTSHLYLSLLFFKVFMRDMHFGQLLPPLICILSSSDVYDALQSNRSIFQMMCNIFLKTILIIGRILKVVAVADTRNRHTLL